LTPVTAQPRRILVLGCSGSGKSTLAAALAERLGLPFIATDPIYWTPDWRPTPAAEVLAWVDGITAGDRWVLDGNFDAERELVWARADLAVWLDLPLARTAWQVARRNLGYWLSRKPVWGAAPMSLGRALSGMRHCLRSHPLKRATYPAELARFSKLQVVRIGSRRALEDWVRTFG
jgi:hypothetical protein